ncbi:MAG: hypothetical protein FD123_94 [Bacteroidetes bacterium]|nr:MAG: hypothetical protein FD123_94 [Bacteroidota bacterium]
MNYLDIIIAIPLLWGFYRGFMKGVIMEAATLAAFFLGVWGGIHLSDGLAGLIRDWTGSESPYIPIISFAVIFVGILMLVFGVAKLVDRFADKASLNIINKIAGGAFGALKFALLVSLLQFVIAAIEKDAQVLPPEIRKGSLLYEPLEKVAPAVIPGLKDSRLGKLIPGKDDIEVGVDVKLKTPKDSVK